MSRCLILNLMTTQLKFYGKDELLMKLVEYRYSSLVYIIHCWIKSFVILPLIVGFIQPSDLQNLSPNKTLKKIYSQLIFIFIKYIALIISFDYFPFLICQKRLLADIGVENSQNPLESRFSQAQALTT